MYELFYWGLSLYISLILTKKASQDYRGQKGFSKMSALMLAAEKVRALTLSLILPN